MPEAWTEKLRSGVSGVAWPISVSSLPSACLCTAHLSIAVSDVTGVFY